VDILIWIATYLPTSFSTSTVGNLSSQSPTTPVASFAANNQSTSPSFSAIQREAMFKLVEYVEDCDDEVSLSKFFFFSCV
jgi:hypothetical protein